MRKRTLAVVCVVFGIAVGMPLTVAAQSFREYRLKWADSASVPSVGVQCSVRQTAPAQRSVLLSRYVFSCYTERRDPDKVVTVNLTNRGIIVFGPPPRGNRATVLLRKSFP